MTQYIDPLSPGSQLAINRLHQQGEGRRNRASAEGIASARNRTALALGGQRSKDYEALREMRERMQMTDISAKERAAEKIMAQVERKRKMQQDFLRYFVDADSKMLDEIQGVSKNLDKMHMANFKAQVMSGRERKHWGQIADQLRQMHQQTLPITQMEGAIQSAANDAIARFSTALPGYVSGGERARTYSKVTSGGHPVASALGGLSPGGVAESMVGDVADLVSSGWAGTWDAYTSPVEYAERAARGPHNAMYAADGLARRIIGNYENDPQLQGRFGGNSGKATDALRGLYFSLLGSRPDAKSEDYLNTKMPTRAGLHYGVETYGELLNKSLATLQDDLKLPLQEIQMLLKAPARGLENATGQRTYRDFVDFHGGNEKKANKELAKLFSVSDPSLSAEEQKKQRESLEDAFKQINLAEVFQNIADMPMLAQTAGVPEAPSAKLLEEMVEWMDKMIRQGGPLAGMDLAPERFGPTEQYGEELLSQLEGNMPVDYGRDRAESQVDILGATRELEGQLGRLQERRTSLPSWAMGRMLE
jgi:hypothetical protein